MMEGNVADKTLHHRRGEPGRQHAFDEERKMWREEVCVQPVVLK